MKTNANKKAVVNIFNLRMNSILKIKVTVEFLNFNSKVKIVIKIMTYLFRLIDNI